MVASWTSFLCFLALRIQSSPWPHTRGFHWLKMDSDQDQQLRLLKEELRIVIDQFVFAAEQGNAQIRLGIECMVGVNVQKDLVKAEE